MDNLILKEHAERCRSLAAMADEFTKKRLLDLAETYDLQLSKASRPSTFIRAPVNLTSASEPAGSLART
jgi:hypothetical protein